MRTCHFYLANMFASGSSFARILEDEFKIKTLIIGDILRTEINNESDLGNKCKAYLNQGLLVPNEIISQLFENEINTFVGDFAIQLVPSIYEKIVSLIRKLDINIGKIWYLKVLDLHTLSQKVQPTQGREKLLERMKNLQLKQNKVVESLQTNFRVETINLDFEKSTPNIDFYKKVISQSLKP